MTEAEWLACKRPQLMLAFLGDNATDRKLRLFACACCRRIWNSLQDSAGRAVEMAERFEDEAAEWDEVIEAVTAADIDATRMMFGESAASVGFAGGKAAVGAATEPGGRIDAAEVARQAAFAAFLVKVGPGKMTGVGYGAQIRLAEMDDEESGAQCRVLHEIVGNPFRPAVVDPSWLTWNDGTIDRIVRPLHRELAFDRLPILADALEDAGCHNADILNHCRESGEHVRGCWVIDLLLGKE